MTGTNKTDKKPLRAERWDTDDPIWHRVDRDSTYVKLGAADVEQLVQEFVRNGRVALIGQVTTDWFRPGKNTSVISAIRR